MGTRSTDFLLRFENWDSITKRKNPTSCNFATETECYITNLPRNCELHEFSTFCPIIFENNLAWKKDSLWILFFFFFLKERWSGGYGISISLMSRQLILLVRTKRTDVSDARTHKLSRVVFSWSIDRRARIRNRKGIRKKRFHPRFKAGCRRRIGQRRGTQETGARQIYAFTSPYLVSASAPTRIWECREERAKSRAPCNLEKHAHLVGTGLLRDARSCRLASFRSTSWRRNFRRLRKFTNRLVARWTKLYE